MRISASRPRFGRLLDIVVVTALFLVFAALAFYHYRRLDSHQESPDLASESAADLGDEPANPSTDWPQWRGPHRNGISNESITTSWPTGGPKQLWKAPVGEGFSSVAVVKGRVFTIFQDGRNESIVSWDAETGKEIWRFSYETAYKNDYGNGPRSTPSIDGELLYVVGATGMMHCLTAFTANPKGEQVWKKDLAADFGAKTPRWGFAFSPLVEDDRVFIMPGGPAGNSLAALDKNTGAVLWKKHDDLASFSSPISATIHGKRQVLFLAATRLVSVDPTSGDLLWEYPWPVENECNIATPIVAKNHVFISTSYGRGCARLRIEKDGDKLVPKLRYKNKEMKNHFSTCVRYKGHVFGFDDGTLRCMNLLTGRKEWSERGFDRGSVLLVGDQLIIYGANGVLALAEANPKTFVERGRFQFSEQQAFCWTVPVVSNGRLYVRDQKRLACFDVRAGN
ncbi:MAG: PQQ-binding-like beta-propeller repeat protein [Planctomycetes bacterium]|nr:PQQ-binding-like beta-propeller repeat protein [Planctomycetota bacterium]